MFVANDMLVNQLWLNRGDLRFEDESLLWGCAVDEHGIEKAGMESPRRISTTMTIPICW